MTDYITPANGAVGLHIVLDGRPVVGTHGPQDDQHVELFQDVLVDDRRALGDKCRADPSQPATTHQCLEGSEQALVARRHSLRSEAVGSAAAEGNSEKSIT